MGELAPCRAFGDVRYKWPAQRLLQMAEYFGAEVPAAEESEMTLGSWAGLTALPSPYTSPPYLTARPDITSLQVRGFPPLPSFLILLFTELPRCLIDKKLV